PRHRRLTLTPPSRSKASRGCSNSRCPSISTSKITSASPPAPEMSARSHSRFWRLCRIYFRRFRICMWLIVLFLLGAWSYLNQVGLPGFVKKPLLDKLHARGIDLQFSRLRLRWYRGIVADNVRFGRANESQGPQLSVTEAEVRLNHKALA